MKIKKETVIKIIISLVLVIIGLVILFLLSNKETPNGEIGKIHFILVNSQEEEVYNEYFDFTEDDNLLALLEKHYNIEYKTDIYGSVLYSISPVSTDFKTSFLAIYVNTKFSNQGISNIVLENNMEIKIVEKKIS